MTTITAGPVTPVPRVVAPRKSLHFINDDTKFYDHQIDGVRRLAKKGSFILADEMGLGKSLQALAVFAVDYQRRIIDAMGAGQPIPLMRALVVCPGGLRANWQEEIGTHTTFTTEILAGDRKQRSAQIAAFAASDKHILLCGYEQVVKHYVELNAIGFEVVIYDEGHYIKSYKSQRSKAAHRLQANRHFVLTGSPMLNHIDDLWSLLHRVAPGEFPNYWRFIQRYAVFGGYEGKQIVGIKPEYEQELIDKVQFHMLRRLKSECLDLPDKMPINLYVDLSPGQRKLYDEINTNMSVPPSLVSGDEPSDIDNAVVRFMKLLQVCSTAANLRGFADDSAKLDLAEERIEELVENGHKVVVFTQFRGSLMCMSDRLDTRGIVNYELHGDVKADDRAPLVRKWADDGKPSVICCMYQVGGVGLNMTAARHMITLDRLFVPKLQEQAEDRLHRIGQGKDPVEIINIIARKTKESRVESILKAKQKLHDKVIDQRGVRRLITTMMEEEDD